MCFRGATLFRGAQEGGYERYDTMSKVDIILPYIPSGMVTTDSELQIEKSLQVAIEGARKTKTAVLIIIGYNFNGMNLRSEWQQQSACAFARILLHVLLQDMNQHEGSSFELISIVVDDQKDQDLYATVFKEWIDRNIQDEDKNLSGEHDAQDVGAAHVRSAIDSSMASAGIDVMSISSIQESTASVSHPQRLLDWLRPQPKEEDLSIVL